MSVDIASAAKYSQPVSRAPAAVRIITRNDIRNNGWRSLNEALASLPGIHISYDHQYEYIGTRGLGGAGQRVDGEVQRLFKHAGTTFGGGR